MAVTQEEVTKWAEENLFGNRHIEGLPSPVPLTPTQDAIKRIAVEIILKWEERHEKLPEVQKLPHFSPHRGKDKLR